MNSKILNFSLIMSLFVTIFSIQSADTTFSKRFSNACAKIEGKIKSQRDLDKQFLMAVYQNNIDDADYWLKAGANINAIQNYNGRELPSFENKFPIQNRNLFALNLAKDSDMIKFLISKGADVNKEIPEELFALKPTPTLKRVIYNAVSYDKPEMIINMIMAGAKVDEKTINYLQNKLNEIEINLEVLKVEPLLDHASDEYIESVRQNQTKVENFKTVIKFAKEQQEVQRKQLAKEIYDTEIFPKDLANEIAGYAI